MKKNYLFKISSIFLCCVLVVTFGSAQKITVLPAQVIAESGVENGQKLFDEQTLAGNPKSGSGGACTTNWLPGWVGGPHSAYVDLGQAYNITDVYLYDYNGTSNFTVESGSPGNWSSLFVDNMAGWQTWNAHAVSVNTRYLRFTTVDGDCRAYEVVLYGAPGTNSDITPPASITNLSVGTISSSSIALSWISPGDDGTSGAASSYDIRYSTSIIANTSDFNNATQVIGEPAPQVAGSNESFTVTGLNANTLYYFAIKTSDEVPNVSTLSNVPNATTSSSGGGLTPLTKTYVHLPSMDPQWNTNAVYNALEPSDFDTHWSTLLSALPTPDGAWNGGTINLGTQGTGYGLVSWNSASTSSKKPILVQLPSAGAAPGIGICPMDNRFIVCSAMNNSTGTVSSAADYETALLAIQQMIRNIQASGNATNDVFVIGKSQGGGTGMMTSALNAAVKDFFLSVPALSGYNGSMGTAGPYPGWASTTANGYVDAVNHAKRYRNKATFSISYDDNVTWGRGQVTCAKNTQYTTTIYHGNDGHNDPDWWTNGTTWLNGCLNNIVNNGVGLVPVATSSSMIVAASPSIRVFPNPFENELKLRFYEEVKGTVRLYSILGSLIQAAPINSSSNTELVINTLLNEFNELGEGVYILEVAGEKSTYKTKIVKK